VTSLLALFRSHGKSRNDNGAGNPDDRYHEKKGIGSYPHRYDEYHSRKKIFDNSPEIGVVIHTMLIRTVSSVLL